MTFPAMKLASSTLLTFSPPPIPVILPSVTPSVPAKCPPPPTYTSPPTHRSNLLLSLSLAVATFPSPSVSITTFALPAPLQTGIAAFLASATATLIIHPLDTLKTRRQHPNTTRTPLYAGLFANILKEAPNAAIYLALYTVFKSILPLPCILSIPLAGMLADAVGSLVRAPPEIVNKRLQLGLDSHWTVATRRAFCTKGGRQSAFSAWMAILCRDVPYGGLQIALYEWFKTIWGCYLVAGGLAGALAAVLTTPMDVLVTRLSALNPQCDVQNRRVVGVREMWARILKEGRRGLWGGAGERALVYLPLIAIFFATFEVYKEWLVKVVAVCMGMKGAWIAWAIVMATVVWGERRKSARSCL